MSDLSKPKQVAPNDDPALVMSLVWQSDFDRLQQAIAFAAEREEVMFATSTPTDDDAKNLYYAAAGARDRMADKLRRLTWLLFKTKAKSFEGVAAKLAVAIRDNAPSPTDPVPPWPQLRAVQRDLDRLVAQLKVQTANDNST